MVQGQARPPSDIINVILTGLSLAYVAILCRKGLAVNTSNVMSVEVRRTGMPVNARAPSK